MQEQLINRVPLFASLSPGEMKRLADSLRPVEFPAGTLLFREGETANQFYFLLDGEIEIIKALGTAEERLLGVREAGTFIGEMSLFSPDGRRTASVRARAPLKALAMSHTDFDALLRRHPTVAYDMVRVLTTRLSESEDATIRDLHLKNRELMKAYHELKAAQAQIVEKEKMEHELEVARRIQRSILPRALPQRPGFDFGAQIVPMSAVGGDFFDFIPLDGDRLGIAVGDVSDHGVPAALFMALTATLLRAGAHRFDSPREVLRSVNHHLLDINDAGMFVTVLYGVLDYATRDFTYARAGHEPLIVFDAHGKWVEQSRVPGQLLGILPEPVLEVQRVTLTPGSTLFLYTDGVNEAFNVRDEMFGEARLRQAIAAHRRDSAQALCEGVLDHVTSFRGRAAQRDDVALAAVQVE
jgi:sigma-B regulation protein RsbU (phosphoserine phosphatase)